MVKLILFDLDKTLVNRTCDFSASERISEELNLQMPRDEIVTIYESVVQTRKWETEKEAYETLAKKLNLPNVEESAQKMIDIRTEADKTFIKMPYTDELLSRLKIANQKIGVLANCQQFQYRWFLEKYPEFFDIFDSVYLSYEIGYMKPNPEVYEHVEINEGVKGNEILMIGDTLENDYEGPIKFGWQALLLKKDSDIFEELANLGISI